MDSIKIAPPRQGFCRFRAARQVDSTKTPGGWRHYLPRAPRPKVVDYLLSQSHPDGRDKAAFFTRFGFRADQWEQLADALREIAASNPAINVVESAYGTRYTVDGALQSPDGRAPSVRTVWMVEAGKLPRLITAHPLKPTT